MDKFKKRLPYLIIIMVAFYILPLFGIDTGSFMLILLVAVPIICFVTSLLYGIKIGFQLFFPIIVALLFFPTIFIYYNASAWMYTFVYAGIAFVGNKLGNHILIRQSK